MNVDLPEWLDEELLKSAVVGGTDTNGIEIRNFKVEPAVESGNNYCSVLYRVKVEYSGEEEASTISKSFIVKAPLSGGGEMQAVVEEGNLVRNEYNVYTNIFPNMFELYKHEFSPKMYFCQVEDVLVLEDLNERGYVMCDRLQQLDYPHCKTFLETLAKYHAATVALHKRDPELVESHGSEPFYKEERKADRSMWDSHKLKFVVVAGMIEQHEGLRGLAQVFREYSDLLRDITIDTLKRRGKLNVLNHGDCWTNNILFKYDGEGQVTDCKLIDFQIRRFGPPAIDIAYFLSTSVRSEVAQHRFNDLLRVYCQTLNETLHTLGCDETLSVGELEDELKVTSPWAAAVITGYLPLILHEPDSAFDTATKHPDDILQSLDINVNPYLKPLQSKTFNRVLPNVCKQLIAWGFVEYLTSIRHS